VHVLPQPGGILYWLLDSVHRGDLQGRGAMTSKYPLPTSEAVPQFSAIVIISAGVVVFVSMAIGFMAGMLVGR
jgi:hypothetical protein